MKISADAYQKIIRDELPWVRADQPVVTHIDVEIYGKWAATADLAQHSMLPPTTNRAVRERGIVGTLFSVRWKPHPRVIVFSGSEGGLNEYLAATLASSDSRHSRLLISI